MPRAAETAEIVGAALGLTHQVAEGLREFDVGRFEGTSAEAGWEEYGSVMRSWLEGDHERRVGGGESLTETVVRLRRFLQGFGAEEGSDHRVALIAHGGLYRMALPHMFANVSPEFAIENTHGYGLLIVAEAKDGKLICLDWDGVPVG